MVGAFPDGERLALVRRYAAGVELDLRAGRQPAVKPWQVVAEIAAAIHAVPGRDVADMVPDYETRAAHARTGRARGVRGTRTDRDARRAGVGLEHGPPDEPSVLLHGDLLGQNILLAVDGSHHVIDWEYATRGDPAYDLAIVTRGAAAVPDRRRPRPSARRVSGAQRLDVSTNQVHLHELCLIAGWHRAALMGEGPPAFDRVRSLLRRLR